MFAKPDFSRRSGAQDDSVILMMTQIGELSSQNAGLKVEVAGLKTKNAELKAENATLKDKIEELEAWLGKPAKTPENSHLPPSKGRKPTEISAPKAKANPHPGAHRPLHPKPTSFENIFATSCDRCGADVSNVEQKAVHAYDRIEIPRIVPDVKRVTLHGGVCPCCEKTFKATPPAELAPGSPFGPNIRAFVVYLKSVHGIPMERLRCVMKDMFGLEISEGSLTNILKAASPFFAKQASLIKQRLLSGAAIASDETTMRVGKANWWLWVFHGGDSAVFTAEARRAKEVVETFLEGRRPDFWTSDRFGSQMDWSTKEHQFCLAHLIRDVQYVVELGDHVFAPELKKLLQHACKRGRAREHLADSTLKHYRDDLDRRLDKLLMLKPIHQAGKKLRETIKSIRGHLFVFMTNRDVDPTNNASERSLRPSAVYRKITNGFRSVWGVVFHADLRSVIETARRRSIPAIDAIRLTLEGKPIPLAA